MAIDYTERYEGQVADGDAAYPYGRAQNVIVEGDGTGTPLEKDLVNDIWGMLQALLLGANLTPSGVADTALASQYAQAVQLLAERSHASTNVKSVGAFGTGVADDTAAIVAAQAAMVTAGGGELFFPPGRYRITEKITRAPSVFWRGVPGLSVIAMDHATENLLEFATGSYVAPVLHYGLDFEADQDNTGVVFGAVSGTPQAIFSRCRVNKTASGLKGAIFSDVATFGSVGFLDCDIRTFILGTALLSDFGEITIEGGRYTMAPGATSDMMYADVLTVRGAKFFHVSTSGDIAFIAFAGSDKKRYKVIDCYFEVNDSGAGSGTFAMKVLQNTKVETDGNQFVNCAPYKVGAAPIGSGRLQLRPAVAYAISGPTVDLAQGYEVHAVVSDDGDPPTVTLAAPLYDGQPAATFIKNASGGAWSGSINFAGVAYQPGGVDNLGDSSTASVSWRAVALGGGLAWVPLGAAVKLAP